MNNLATIGQYLMNIRQQIANIYGNIDEMKREIINLKVEMESCKKSKPNNEDFEDRITKLEKINSTLDSIFSALPLADSNASIPIQEPTQPVPQQTTASTLEPTQPVPQQTTESTLELTPTPPEQSQEPVSSIPETEEKQDVDDLILVPKKPTTKRKVNKK